jgi:deazaflavin-dependent oxidoreductase (nitroreductase family)
MTTMTQSQTEASVCYLETIGRVSGNPHQIEIWFAADGDTVWMLSGGMDRSDWVKNILGNPAVRVRILDQWLAGAATVVDNPDDDQRARECIARKYYHWTAGPLPTDWTRTALPIKIRISSG